MLYRSQLVVWASVVLVFASPQGHAQTHSDARLHPWTNPPVPTVQSPGQGAPLQSQPKPAGKSSPTPAVPRPRPQVVIAAPPPPPRCVRVSASQTGFGRAETLALVREQLPELARVAAIKQGWSTSVSKVREVQNCDQKFVLPLFGVGFECKIDANFCVR